MKPRTLLATASLLIAGVSGITPSLAQGLLPETPQSLAGLPHVPKYRAFLPAKVDLSADFPPAGYQGELGTCVGWAVGYSLRSYMAHRSTGVDLKQQANRFNPLFVYNSVSTDCTTGAVLTAGMSFISKQGALPFSSDNSLQCNPGRAEPARLNEAASYRIGAVKLIPIQDIDTISAATFPIRLVCSPSHSCPQQLQQLLGPQGRGASPCKSIVATRSSHRPPQRVK